MQACFVFETSPTLRKMWPFTRFWRKLIVISLLLEIFARLNAVSIAFYTPNTMHSFIVETITPVRKMRPFTRLWITLSIVSLLLEIFRGLNDIFIAFWTPNVVHGSFNVETSIPERKIRPFKRFRRKLSVISLLLGIFRRLNAFSIAFYTRNAVHVVLNDQTIQTMWGMQTFTRFWRKLIVLSLLLGIVWRLNAISTGFYKPNAINAVFRVETCPTVRKIRPFTRFWRKLCVIWILL